MPQTVAEVLKSAGWDEAAIAALDAKALEGFNGVLTVAATAQQAAETERRAAVELFEKQITPALNDWGNREANLQAERDYFKTLAEKAKTGGFLAEVPPFQPAQAQPGQRGADGRFVPGANAVPGSPSFQEFESKAATAIGNLADLQWKYRSLFGKEMPDAPTALGAEAAANRMQMTEWAARKYDFAGREAAIKKEAEDKQRDSIRKEAIEERDKYWAERGGSNPNVRQATTSQFAELKKGVAEGTRIDPLKMTREQRHAATAAAIRQDAATNTIQ